MSPSPDATLLAGALQLAGAGLRVHPLRGKLPLMEDWPQVASNDPQSVRSFWTNHPCANVGVVTGDDGLFVLDVDARKDGERHLNAMVAREGRLPRCPLVRTGGGGWHLYLRAPVSVRNSTSKVATGVDVRGVGGQVVAPPSIHASGRPYRWMPGLSIDEVPVPAAPGWLLDRLRPVRSVPARPRPQLPALDASVTERARRYLARLPPAVSGSGGHQATWFAALALVRGFGLPEDVALDILLGDFNPRCQPPWSEHELLHKVSSASKDATADWGYLLNRRAA